MPPWQLRLAAATLRGGGVIAYPTETVYGLGCDPLNPEAVETLLALKRRPVEKGLILIAATVDQLLPYIDVTDNSLLQKMRPSDRPVTWVCPATPKVPDWLTGRHSTIAVRITSHPIAHDLCLRFGGAIVSTSANPAGHPPARSALTVRRYFNEQLDYLLHTAYSSASKPSEIRDLLSNTIYRRG